jgi:hypothetical protein
MSPLAAQFHRNLVSPYCNNKKKPCNHLMKTNLPRHSKVVNHKTLTQEMQCHVLQVPCQFLYWLFFLKFLRLCTNE